MGARFQPARVPSGGVESINVYPALAGQAIVKGSLVLLDANGLLNLCGADPASILGVALSAQGGGPGFSAANSPIAVNFSTANEDLVSVAIANRETIFSGKMTNAGNIVTPTQAMVGDSYGVVNTAGIWTVDQTETVNTRLTIVDVDIANTLVFFKFLNANLQLP